MASFADQVAASRAAGLAVAALEQEGRRLIDQAFQDWDAGLYDAQTIRHRIERVVRESYRTAAALGPSVAVRAADLPDWVPAVPFNPDYLKSLLVDVRRNLRAYKSGDSAAKRRAIMNIQHGAGVGASRGYTDASISAFTELEDFGYVVEKTWANNVSDGHTPCDECIRLHGMTVPVSEPFPVPTLSKTKVYKDLMGPPRHPRCQCYLITVVRSLENALEELDLQDPSESPNSMNTNDVKKIPRAIFLSIVAALSTIKNKFRRKKS